MKVLGIESSCDETALALVDTARPPAERVLSHALFSQIEIHAETGGVVPEVAARAHVDRIAGLAKVCFAEANLDASDVDMVAAIAGPGLIGGVSVGLMFGKGFALTQNIPLVPVNHLAGHALTCRLTDDTPFPYLLLLVSGGHCQILVVESATAFQRWATTIDDAVGEAFDKAAKVMGLDFPGGPALEIEAMGGDASRFDLPRPMIKKPTMDFSFSGLKTGGGASLRHVRKQPRTGGTWRQVFRQRQPKAWWGRLARLSDALQKNLARATRWSSLGAWQETNWFAPPCKPWPMRCRWIWSRRLCLYAPTTRP